MAIHEMAPYVEIRGYQYVQSYKYLGTLISCKGYKLDIQTTVESFMQRLLSANMVANQYLKQLYLRPSQRREIFLAFTSWVFYQAAGLPIWNERRIHQATTIMATGLRQIYGLKRSTPVEVIWHAAGLMAPDCHIMFADLGLVKRLKENGLNGGDQDMEFMYNMELMSRSFPEIKLPLSFDQMLALTTSTIAENHMRRRISARIAKSTGSLKYFGNCNQSRPWNGNICLFMKRRSWYSELVKRASVERQEWYQALRSLWQPEDRPADEDLSDENQDESYIYS
jgi:hypothetical protein